jgi:hypothetical protein
MALYVLGGYKHGTPDGVTGSLLCSVAIKIALLTECNGSVRVGWL